MSSLRILLFLILVLGPSLGGTAYAQITRTATFTRGAVGQYGVGNNNAHQPTNVLTFADLNISNITISQTTANGAWGGTQGNDTAVTVVITYSNGLAPVTFQAAINWVKNAGGGGYDWVGLGTSAAVPDNYPLTAGARQSYALQYPSSTVTITTGMNINGSANTSGAMTSLNNTFPLVNPPSFTGTNSTSGGNPSYAFSYFENRPAGTTVGTVTATGGNGAPLSFSITSGNSNGWFAINSATGAITLTAAGAASLANDFETAPNIHTLTVQVTDGYSPVTVQVALTELDIVEPPVFTGTNSTDGGGNPAYAFSYEENQPAGATLGSVSATGGNGGALSFSITSGNSNGWFAINSATGAITLTAAGAASLANDFEAMPNVHVLVVTVSDGITPVTAQVTLTELDVFEAPPLPLTVVKTSQVAADPVNGSSQPKAIPGSRVNYSILIANPGTSVVSGNSIAVVDPTPSNMSLYVADLAGSGPVLLQDGSPSSGLEYTFTSLASQADDVDFSSDGGATWTYVPTPNAAGADPNVTHIRIRPQGTMAAGSSFTLVLAFIVN